MFGPGYNVKREIYLPERDDSKPINTYACGEPPPVYHEGREAKRRFLFESIDYGCNWRYCAGREDLTVEAAQQLIYEDFCSALFVAYLAFPCDWCEFWARWNPCGLARQTHHHP